MTHGMPLRLLAEQWLEAGVREIVVDLRECTYMDSTFLGTLLTLHRTLEARSLSALTLVAPSTACAKIFHDMGMNDLFRVVSEPTVPLPSEMSTSTSWTELSLQSVDPIAQRRNIIEAHEHLAALPGEAGEQFQAVIRCMAQNEPKPPPE